MKIAYITAGAAGMYCGSCLHDNTLAKALIRLGHEATLIPTYTPIRTDEEDVSIDRVFYGAISVYLEQKSSLFRHTPRFVDRVLNARRMLDWASGRSSSTDARLLGELTLSVLQGEEGKQRKELEQLVDWLEQELRPDVVHLTNSMFLGFARMIRQRLGVPVLCSVQGEDLFLEQLEEPHRSRVHATLRERSRDANGFVATSQYGAETMAELLGVDAARMHVVELGIDTEGFAGDTRRPADDPFVVAYLARQCPEKGLHLAAEAFRELAARKGPERVRFRVAGYLDPRNEDYVEAVFRDLRDAGLEGSVERLGEVDRPGKIALLSSAHVVSVPTVYREPKGLFVLESFAAGTPVVQPDHGAFPRLVGESGGGLLVEPGSVEASARALERLFDDRRLASDLGERGRASVEDRYNDAAMARSTLAIYERSLAGA